MKKYAYLVLVALSLLFSCQKNEREFPSVITSADISVVDDGVYVHGRVERGGAFNIVDYGFIYYLSSSSGDNYDQVSLGNGAGIKDFSVKIERNLLPGEPYILKAFVRTDAYVVFGDPQSFVSKGGKAPNLKQYEPHKAQIGDTLTINGEYFADVADANNIYFGRVVSHPIFSNDSVMKVVVPTSLETAENIIKVEVGGKSSSFTDKFEVALPVINEIQPANVLPGEKILMKGSGLGAVNGLLVDDGYIPAEDVSDTAVSFSINYRIQPGIKVVEFDWLSQIIRLNNTYNVVYPTISSVSPQVAWLDSVLTIKGEHVDMLTNFKIGGIDLQEVSKNDSMAKLRVVSVFNTATLNARYYGSEVETGLQVKLNMPVITSIAPPVAHAGDQITLNGERFFSGMTTSMGYLQVQNSHHASLLLPWDLTTGSHTIDLEYGFDISIGTVSFNVPKLRILDYYPKQIQRGDTVTVVVANLPENLTGAYWCAFDSRGGEIVGRSGDELKVTVPSNAELSSNPSLSVFFGGQEDNISNAFVLDEKWRKVNSQNYIRGGAELTFLESKGEHFAAYVDQSNTVLKKFDSSTEIWKQVDQTNLFQYLGFLTSFSLADDLYFIAGNSDYPNGVNYKYSTIDKTWTKIADFPVPISLGYKMFSFVINGKAYAGNLKGFFQYDSQNDQWVTMKPLPTSHYEMRFPLSFSFNNAGYVAFNTQIINGVEYNELWRFDASTGVWENKGSLPLSLYEGGTATIYNDKVYITGKSYQSGDNFIEYNPVTGQSKQLVSAPHGWSGDFYSFSTSEYFYFLGTSSYGNSWMYKIPLDQLGNIYMN